MIGLTSELTVYRGDKKTVLKAEKGENLLELLQENGFNLPAPCGGGAICGKCKFKLLDGNFDINQAEKDLLDNSELKNGVRLACCHNINYKTAIELFEIDEMEILTDGIEVELDFDPLITQKKLKITKPTLEDQRDYLTRIIDYNSGIKDINNNLLPKLAELSKKRELNAVLKNDIIIDLNEVGQNNKTYGIAVDIGTTTIVMYLIDLSEEKEIKIHSFENPQKKFGADVVSRINYTIENKNALIKMQKELIKSLNEGIAALIEGTKIKNENIYHLSIVGNTVMLHSLLGVSAENIAKAPYVPIFTEEIILDARDLEIDTNKNAVIQLLPSVSSYVGADIVGDLLVIDYSSNDWSLMIDIGTNGEIVLAKNNKIYVCSAAAGPAFEGANITHGAAGIPGAISVYNQNGYQTIAHKNAIGICGSGLVDIISFLLEKEYINKNGAFKNLDQLSSAQKNNILEYNGQKAFLVASKEESANEENIILTQKDIREFQLAKGAIAAGIQTLIREANISFRDVKTVYLAGGFGSYINSDSARRLGLIPNLLTDNIVKIGNGAGLGAKINLLDKKKINISQNIIANVEYIELSKRKDFQNFFMENMIFDYK